MRVEIDKMYYGNYKFIVELDTGAETGIHQLTVWYLEKVQQESHAFGDERFLRDFYFEETNTNYIRNFCRKFASSEVYRQLVLSREAAWAQRNALFLRNLPLARECFGHSHAEQRKLFQWMSKHYEAIIELPDYQYLQQIDRDCKSNTGEVDPFMQQAIELLNQVPGITTRRSCQGIAGKVSFQGHELLAVSEHEQHAYVSFSQLKRPARDALESLLPEFSSITNIPLPGASWFILRSTGDNLRFRTELVDIARRVYERVSK